MKATANKANRSRPSSRAQDAPLLSNRLESFLGALGGSRLNSSFLNEGEQWMDRAAAGAVLDATRLAAAGRAVTAKAERRVNMVP